MKATVATPAPEFSDWELGFDLRKTMKQNLDEAAKVAFEWSWGNLELQINTGWPAVGWIQAATKDYDEFAYFSFEALARQAAWEVATNYSEQFREQNIEETKLHLAAVRDELLKAVKVFEDAIADPIAATKEPSSNPLDYATPEHIEQMKKDCGGRAYPFSEPDEG